MKAIYGIILLLLSILLVFGSSGNFRSFDGEREVMYQVADRSNSYIAFSCTVEDDSSGCSGDSEVAITITNNLNEVAEVYIYSDSNLIEFSNPTALYPGETSTIEGTLAEHHGNFTANLQIVAIWDGGSAVINACTLSISSHQSSHDGCCENENSGGK